jgi:hypothetical protein
VSWTAKMHQDDFRKYVACSSGNHSWTTQYLEHLGSAVSGRAAEPPGQQSLGKAFVTALLLTGNLDEAETAVLDGIRSLDPDGELEEALVRHTVSAAIQRRPEVQISIEELRQPSSILPDELRPLMYLSPHLRHCFVLRVLLGWPAEICAELLNLEIFQMEALTRAAMLRVAYIDDVFGSLHNSQRKRD